jgi:lysozyme
MTRQQKIILFVFGAGLLTLISKKVSASNFIAKWEGLKLQAYRDIVGIWTIGFGNTFNPFTGEPVKQGLIITENEARRWLNKTVGDFREKVEALVKVPLKDTQLDALTSLAYNIGLGAFQRSTLLRLLNAGQPAETVAEQFLRWNRAAGKVVRGLTLRRQAEKDLFLR